MRQNNLQPKTCNYFYAGKKEPALDLPEMRPSIHNAEYVEFVQPPFHRRAFQDKDPLLRKIFDRYLAPLVVRNILIKGRRAGLFSVKLQRMN